jgi:TrmH family RNA methyltransferase
VRASLGALFSLPVIESAVEPTIVWLRSHGIQIVAATPEGTHRYTDEDYTGPTAIVMGSEAFGLGPQWHDAADHLATIPMFGTMDSLNLATSTALMLYEVVRQRNMLG